MSLSARSLGLARRLWGSRWVHLAVGAVASVGLAYIAARSIGWRDFLDTFVEFPIGFALLALIPMAGAMLLRAARWYVLLQDQTVSYPKVLLTQQTGLGLNNMLPIRMVSEPVQLVLITRRYRVPFPQALATLVGGNVLDIVATAVILTAGLLLIPGMREARVSIQLFGAFVMFVVSVLIFLVVARGLDTLPIARRVGFFQRLASAIDLLRGRPVRLWASFAATVGHWASMGMAGWILAEAVGIDVDPLAMTTILVAATFFISAVPSLPGGAGTFHFAVVTMLTALGADDAAAFSLAIVVHLLIVVPSILIATVMLMRVGASVLLHKEPPPELPANGEGESSSMPSEAASD